MRTLSVCIRSTATLVLVGVCLFLCLGFWFTRSEWDPTIFGRYSLKWFAGAVAINVILVLLAWGGTRAVWSAGVARERAPRRIGSVSLGRRVLFLAILFVPLLVGLEAALRFLNVAPLPPEPLHIAGTARHYHAFLQQVDRIEADGKLVRAYRGRVYSPAKTAGMRVVCLGGSTTWGHRLPLEDTWPAILEEMLIEDGYDIEIINAARPWYTTAHSLVNYCLQMRRYDPDIVIIMHGINDLERSFPQPGEAGVESDYGSYQGPMRHVLETYEQRRGQAPFRVAELLEGSAVYRLIRNETALDRKFYSDLRREAKPDGTLSVDVGLDAFPTVALFRSNLEYLARLCLWDGCRVLLSTQPHVYERSDLPALDGVPEVTRKHFLVNADGVPISRTGVRLGMRAIREATLEVAAGSGLPVVDAERVIGARLEYFIDDLHLNGEGNREIAMAIAETLRLVIDPRRATDSPG